MRIAWTTDPHLNFVDDSGIDQYIAEVREAHADAVLVGGDIGEADTFAVYLERMSVAVDVPVHFVLGNHDTSSSPIVATKAIVSFSNDFVMMGSNGRQCCRCRKFSISAISANQDAVSTDRRYGSFVRVENTGCHIGHFRCKTKSGDVSSLGRPLMWRSGKA